jgi:CBS-domain-containing membrane protein
MTIESLMSRNVQHCRPDQTLEDAAAQMWEHDCGCMPVCSGDGEPRLIGMLTDRDICMAAMFQGRPLRELKIADAMSHDIRVCQIDDRPEDVELLMREQRIRRVPVIDSNGALIGIVSLADLARAAHDRAAFAGIDDAVSEAAVAHTLAAICEPGSPRPSPPE